MFKMECDSYINSDLLEVGMKIIVKSVYLWEHAMLKCSGTPNINVQGCPIEVKMEDVG